MKDGEWQQYVSKMTRTVYVVEATSDTQFMRVSGSQGLIVKPAIIWV